MQKFCVRPRAYSQRTKSGSQSSENFSENLENPTDSPEKLGLTPPARRKKRLHVEACAERRRKVIEEIISSEKAYLDHMNMLIRFFVDPMSVCDILTSSEVKVLFGETRSIRLVNQVLYDHLEHGDIIGAFATLTPFLKLYSSYARNFPSSQHLLEELHGRRGFTAFLKRQENLPDVKGLKFPALLIMPIQRIPRYKLLLEDLKSCSLEPCDVAQVDEVLSQLKEVAEYVNDCVKDYDNTLTIMKIQKMLDSCAPKLMVPGRKFVKEGLLKKVSQHGKHKMLERMVWLFNDILVYGKPHARKKNYYLCSCVFPLRHCYTERMMGQNMFKISCKGETLYLAADEFQTIDSWVTALEETILELRTNRITLRKESSKRTPQNRKFLNAARRRTSSLSMKIQRKHDTLRQESHAENEKGSESRCDRWLDGVVNLVTRNKRKRVYTPVKPLRFAGLTKSPGMTLDDDEFFQEEKRPRLAVRPRLATLPEEESDTSFSINNESFCAGHHTDLNYEPSPTKSSSKRWWEEEKKKQEEHSSHNSSVFGNCNLM